MGMDIKEAIVEAVKYCKSSDVNKGKTQCTAV